jgi:predicted RNA-binding protein YlqC (UPF0109 family)
MVEEEQDGAPQRSPRGDVAVVRMGSPPMRSLAIVAAQESEAVARPSDIKPTRKRVRATEEAAAAQKTANIGEMSVQSVVVPAKTQETVLFEGAQSLDYPVDPRGLHTADKRMLIPETRNATSASASVTAATATAAATGSMTTTTYPERHDGSAFSSMKMSTPPASVGQQQSSGTVKGIVTTTMVIPLMFMQQVVGPQGEILMAVKVASGADVTARTQGAPSADDFLVVLSGAFEQVHAAFGIVIKFSKHPATQEWAHSCRLQVSRDDASGLIGRKGSVVHEIRALLTEGPNQPMQPSVPSQPQNNPNNCFRINTSTSPSPIVDVQGSADLCMRAHYEIHCRLQKQFSRAALRGEAVPHDVGREGVSAASSTNKVEGSGDDAVVDDGEQEEEQLKITVDVGDLGNLMGRGGGRIKEIRAQSGARIFIESKEIEPQRRARNVTVVGTKQQKDMANYLVQLAVHNGQLPGLAPGSPEAQQAAVAWASIEQAGSRGGALGASATVGIVAGTAVGVGGGSGAAHLAGGGDGVAPTSAVFGSLTGGVYGNGHAAVGPGYDAIQATKNATGPDGGRLKLSLCRNFRTGMGCSYGDRCGFAHGEIELEQHRAHAAKLGLPQTATAAATLTMDPATTSVVQVPSHQLGMILGRGGARIKEMRAQSGAKIQVEDKAVEPERQLRNVMISGTVEQRQWAAYLIAMAIQNGEAQKVAGMAAAYGVGGLGQPVFANPTAPASGVPATPPVPPQLQQSGASYF